MTAPGSNPTDRTASTPNAATIAALLRADLRGRRPYGAPQLSVATPLNTNENSYALPSAVCEALQQTTAEFASNLNRYPDREFTALRQALASYLTSATVRIEPQQVWAANGSNEVLLHVLQAFGGAGRCALGFTPAYSMHPIITQVTGTGWIDGQRGQRASDSPEVPGSAARGVALAAGAGPGQFDLSLESAVQQVQQHQVQLIFICSPNNPTGTAVDLATICALYDAAPEAVLLVDEAYHEFARTGTPSALSLLPGRPRLAVSRTMSKAFGFAGGRLGYLAADPAFIDALRLVRMPYHLSTATQAFAVALLHHAPALLANVEVIRQQRDRIVTQLHRLGLRPVPSDGNFVLFGGLADAPATFAALLEQGVLVRDVGLPGHLRVTAGTPQETTAFLDALGRLVTSSAVNLPN